MSDESKTKKGRPPRYSDPQDMQEDVDRYFYDCYVNRLQGKKDKYAPGLEDYIPDPFDEKFNKSTHDEHPSVAGLALAIGMDRRSTINYEAKDAFFPVINAAKTRINAHLEQKMYDHSAGITLMAKNNFKYVDKSEQALTGAEGKPLFNKHSVEIHDAPDFEGKTENPSD